jgi:hypothetical protein
MTNLGESLKLVTLAQKNPWNPQGFGVGLFALWGQCPHALPTQALELSERSAISHLDGGANSYYFYRVCQGLKLHI